jgi:hypothetical protein
VDINDGIYDGRDWKYDLDTNDIWYGRRSSKEQTVFQMRLKMAALMALELSGSPQNLI